MIGAVQLTFISGPVKVYFTLVDQRVFLTLSDQNANAWKVFK